MQQSCVLATTQMNIDKTIASEATSDGTRGAKPSLLGLISNEGGVASTPCPYVASPLILAIWKARNKFIFQGRSISFHYLCMSIFLGLFMVVSLFLNTVKGQIFVSILLQGFNPFLARLILFFVLWSIPWYPWFKLRMHGLPK